jgi:hypothetical protein
VGAEDSSAIDVIVDGSLHDRRPIAGGAQKAKFDLPAGVHQLEVWLPQFGAGLVGFIELEDFGVLLPSPPAALRWGAYGSSITQCRTAEGPSETWPAIASRSLNWELSNLGFSGECHLDPIAASTIRDAGFDIISMCLGINIYRRSTFNARSLQPAVSGFIDTVRAGNPDTPIVVVTAIASPSNESVLNDARLTLEDVRAAIERSVDALRRRGDDLLTLVDGRELLGATDAALLVDGVHPSAEGYRLLAARITPYLRDAVHL